MRPDDRIPAPRRWASPRRHPTPRTAFRAVLLAFLFGALSPEARTAPSEPSPVPSSPLDFRQRLLSYTGPELEAPDAVLTEVRIGWFGPSDPRHPLSGGMWTAACMAVDEANGNGGYQGRPFRLVPYWSENPWTGGVGPLIQAVYRQRLWALIGGPDGPSTHLAEQAVAKARLPLVSPVSTDESVNLAGVPWVFSCAPDDGQIASVLARAVLQATRRHRNGLALLSATDHDSRVAAREILKALADQQGVPGLRLESAPGDTELGPQLRAVQQAKPGSVLIVADAADSARIVKGLRGLGLGWDLFGTHHLTRLAFHPTAAQAEGIHVPRLFTVPEEDGPARAFAEAFMARHGTPPDYIAAYTYDATSLLLEAVRRGGLNRARVRDALSRLISWRGVTGPFQWDNTGRNTGHTVRMDTLHACASGDGDSAVPAGASRPGRPTQ